MKLTILKYTALIFSALLLLTACGGDGENGAASEYNLLDESATPTPPTPTPPLPPLPPLDRAPIADINASLDIPVGDDTLTIDLDGSGSFDPDKNDTITLYLWTLESTDTDNGAALTSPFNAKTSIKIEKEGTYKITLKVSDKENVWSTPDTTYIIYNKPKPTNQPPVAVPLISQSKVMVYPGKDTNVILDGSFSKDDGRNEPLSFEWKNAGGILIGYPRARLIFSCSDDWMTNCYDEQQNPICTYTNTLTVSDGEYNDSKSVDVSVDYSGCDTPPVIEPPVAVAKTLNCSGPSSHSANEYWWGLDGRESSGDDLTYTWGVYLDGSLNDDDRYIEKGDDQPEGMARFKVNVDADGIGISAVLIELNVTNSAGLSRTLSTAFPAVCPKDDAL